MLTLNSAPHVLANNYLFANNYSTVIFYFTIGYTLSFQNEQAFIVNIYYIKLICHLMWTTFDIALGTL